MRIVVTGQVGLDKKPFLARAAELAARQGRELAVFNVGKMMYAEAPDVAPGKILDLPLSRLNSLRRSVFKDILASPRAADVAVNTHATFRWRHGLFYAFDYDHMKALEADLYVVIVDNIDRVHYRLVRDGHVDHTLKDLMVWREEEILATELLSRIVSPSAPGGPAAAAPSGQGRLYILARGEGDWSAETLVKLIFNSDLKKAYLSFPMTHANGGEAGGAELLAEIESFRLAMKRHFICFDPGDLEEKFLAALALKAVEEGHRTVETGPPGERAVMETHQLLDIIPDIDGPIYARDFKLIDQADMIVSLIPELPDGRPAISSGVERELQHAHEATRDTFVIWRPRVEPSPFITETATQVFPTVEAAVAFFVENDYIPRPAAGSLFE